MNGLLRLAVAIALLSVVIRLPLYAALLALLIGVALVFFFRTARDRAGWLLGLVLPILPMAGSGALLSAVAILVLGCWRDLRFGLFRPFAPFLGLAGLAVLIPGAWDVSSFGLLGVWQNLPDSVFDKLLALRAMARVSPPTFLLAAEQWLRFFLIAALFALWDRTPRLLGSGLLWGMLLAAGVTALQLVDLLPFALPNQSAYWDLVDRPSGSFTDPNSMGVFLVLALPWLWSQRHSLGPTGTLLVACWAGLGCFSGSRSFIVGMLLIGGVWLYQSSRRRAEQLALACGAFILVVNVAHILMPESVTYALHSAPPSISRAVETVVVSRMPEAMSSRFIFWEIASRIWVDAPGFGIGLGRVRDVVPYYSSIVAPHIGAYTDNANSFYLGILAELGLAGALAFLWLVYSLRWAETDGALRAVLGVFAVLLCLGPHLEFDEVAVLFGLLLTEVAGVRARTLGGAHALSLVVIAMGAVVSFSGRDSGLYAVEREGGELRRWTMGAARVQVRCDDSATAALTLRALQPGLDAQPVTVTVGSDANARTEIVLADREWHTISMPCGREEAEIRLRLDISSVWVPRLSGVGEDGRILGVQLAVPKPRSLGRL